MRKKNISNSERVVRIRRCRDWKTCSPSYFLVTPRTKEVWQSSVTSTCFKMAPKLADDGTWVFGFFPIKTIVANAKKTGLLPPPYYPRLSDFRKSTVRQLNGRLQALCVKSAIVFVFQLTEFGLILFLEEKKRVPCDRIRIIRRLSASSWKGGFFYWQVSVKYHHEHVTVYKGPNCKIVVMGNDNFICLLFMFLMCKVMGVSA